jgi:hypothetical protein
MSEIQLPTRTFISSVTLAIILGFNLISSIAPCQTELPMKGSFIYYSFNETMSNEKHCLKYFSTGIDKNGTFSTPPNFMENVRNQIQNLNKTSYKLSGRIEQTMVLFTPSFYAGDFSNTNLENHCKGEAAGDFSLILPVENTSLLEGYLFFELATRKKFKIATQSIHAVPKIIWTSDNQYSLVFTQFRIKYMGREGSTMKQEEASLEEIYEALKKNESNKKMYDNGMETMLEIDRIVKECARIYSQELKKAIEFDEL